MKSEIEWEQDIIHLTIKIHQEYPELSKYLKEMPIREPAKDRKGINIQNLEEYYNSLLALWQTYSKTHPGQTQNDT
jgi:hypothetical protein